MSISVVVCAYTTERWDDICAAVRSVLTQDRPADELLLVIDHNEHLAARARRTFTDGDRSSSPVRVLENTQQRGLSGARNTGVAAATSEVVAFLDDDATAEPTWLQHMAAAYADPRVAGIGGAAQPVWPTGGRPAWMPLEFDWVIGCSYRGLPTTTAPVRNFIGANMSLRRSALNTAGSFSSAIGRVGKKPLGCEETELCIRVSQRLPDARLLYDPDMVVHHRVSDDRVQVGYFLRRCYQEGISKAMVSRLVGAGDALDSERTYVVRVLPVAVVRGLIEAVRPRPAADGGHESRLAGPSRSALVVAGLAVTVVGYVRGVVVAAARRRSTTS